MMAYRRKVLAIALRNGKADSVSELNASSDGFGWVDVKSVIKPPP